MELRDRVHMQELDEGVVRVSMKLEKADPYYRRCIRKKFPFGEFDGYVEMVQESLETCEKLYLVKYLSGEKEHLSLANVKKWALKEYAPEAKKKPHRSNAELEGTAPKAMKSDPASKESKTGETDGTATRSAAALRTAAWRAKKKAEAAAAGAATPSRTRAMKDGERRPKVRKTVTKGQDKPRKVKKLKKEGEKDEKSDKSEQPMKKKKAPVEGSGKKDAMAKTGTTTKTKKHPGRPPCNITGCGKYSQGKKQYEDDAHGPPGYRCHRHRAIAATT